MVNAKDLKGDEKKVWDSLEPKMIWNQENSRWMIRGLIGDFQLH